MLKAVHYSCNSGADDNMYVKGLISQSRVTAVVKGKKTAQMSEPTNLWNISEVIVAV